jgi:hypothetical protein
MLNILLHLKDRWNLMLGLYLVKIPCCKSTLVNDFVFSSSLWDGWVDAVCIYVFICVICTWVIYILYACVYICICIYMCVFVCMYIYIYITICNLRTIYNIIISYLEFDPYRYIPPSLRTLAANAAASHCQSAAGGPPSVFLLGLPRFSNRPRLIEPTTRFRAANRSAAHLERTVYARSSCGRRD